MKLVFLFFFYVSGDHRDLHSFPTRRSSDLLVEEALERRIEQRRSIAGGQHNANSRRRFRFDRTVRSEEHTSELQSRRDLVCRLLLEKKKISGRCCRDEL